MNAACIPEQHVQHRYLTVSTLNQQGEPKTSFVPGGDCISGNMEMGLHGEITVEMQAKTNEATAGEKQMQLICSVF